MNPADELIRLYAKQLKIPTFAEYQEILLYDTEGNVLTVGYDNAYTHSFSRYAPNLGRDKDKYMIPRQFSHNVNVSYGIRGGRYNFSIECRNITDERLYDNFKLQRPGRAFYGKVRIAFGG